MKILLSAFACNPLKGSEPGIGWAWARGLAEAGHEVLVLTRDWDAEVSSQALRERPLDNLSFHYIPLRFPRYLPLIGVYPYYALWQAKTYFLVKKSLAAWRPDCIQHITYGSFRTPFFMAQLPVPTIFGPVGGGETTPLNLLEGLSRLGQITETLRTVANRVLSFNPISRMVFRKSRLILAATPCTQRMVPRRYQSKSRSLPAISSPEGVRRLSPRPKGHPLKALFVGRMLEWKGQNLAIQALMQLPAGKVRLTMHGAGGRVRYFHELAKRSGVNDSIEWSEADLNREGMARLYDDHDLLLFPSLHDSGGAVVLEAMSLGLPVICLDLGGPAMFVDSTCGAKIPARKRKRQEVLADLASALLSFAEMDSDQWQRMREGAVNRTAEFTIAKSVTAAHGYLQEVMTAKQG